MRESLSTAASRLNCQLVLRVSSGCTGTTGGGKADQRPFEKAPAEKGATGLIPLFMTDPKLAECFREVGSLFVACMMGEPALRLIMGLVSTVMGECSGRIIGEGCEVPSRLGGLYSSLEELAVAVPRRGTRMLLRGGCTKVLAAFLLLVPEATARCSRDESGSAN